ncbi:MAG: phage portal protein [Caulobacteraceae bacterium]|nr:phage portal protein [Caulobacteraceae bacterium]
MLKLFRKSRMNIEALAAQLGLSAMIKPARGMVTDETALSITAVFCAARVIAEGIGQMPVRVVKEEFDRASNLPRLSVARDHWAHRLLAVRPNEWQTAYEFREGMIFNAVLAGGALAIKNVVNGRVVELLPVRPNQWTVEQLSDWSLAVRVTMADGTYSRFDLSHRQGRDLCQRRADVPKSRHPHAGAVD